MGGKACLPLSGCPSHLPWERHLWDKEKRGCNVCAEHTFPLQSGERGAYPSIFLLPAGGGPGAWGVERGEVAQSWPSQGGLPAVLSSRGSSLVLVLFHEDNQAPLLTHFSSFQTNQKSFVPEPAQYLT